MPAERLRVGERNGPLGTVIPGGLFSFCAGCPSGMRPASPSTQLDEIGNVPQ